MAEYLQINVNPVDELWTPGLNLVHDPKYKQLFNMSIDEKRAVQRQFAEYLAIKLKDLLRKRIKTQYSHLKWMPLTEDYLAYKKKMGLSQNIWEATGLLVKSIKVYTQRGKVIVGIPPNKRYPNSKTRVLYVARCLEYGTRYMPPRPLFRPTINFMKKHIKQYFLDFLSHPLANVNRKRFKEEWQV